jgi:hypothetical protein
MNKAVRPDQASGPIRPAFRSSTHERLISRVLFETADGQIHQTSVYSTLALDVKPGTPEAEARIRDFTDIYCKIGATVLKMEFIDQVGIEIGADPNPHDLEPDDAC